MIICLRADHVTYIVKKVAKYVPILHRVKECLPRFAIKMVCHAIIYPHFLYCCTIWGGCNKTTIKPLQELNNVLIRVIRWGTRLKNTYIWDIYLYLRAWIRKIWGRDINVSTYTDPSPEMRALHKLFLEYERVIFINWMNLFSGLPTHV